MRISRALLPIAVIAFLSGCTSFTISEEDVSGMSAYLHNRPDKGPDIQEFEIPESFHKKILDLLNGASPHRSEIDWAVLGEIKIKTDSGPVDLQLFSAGKKVVFHVSEGGSYETESLKDLIRTIEEAKNAQTEQ